jgi:hypothetical protein
MSRIDFELLLLLSALVVWIGCGLALWSEYQDRNTVTIHKTQDRLPVACQEGAQ